MNFTFDMRDCENNNNNRSSKDTDIRNQFLIKLLLVIENTWG